MVYSELSSNILFQSTSKLISIFHISFYPKFKSTSQCIINVYNIILQLLRITIRIIIHYVYSLKSKTELKVKNKYYVEAHRILQLQFTNIFH